MFAIPLHADSASLSSTSRVLYLIIIVTLQLLWWFAPTRSTLLEVMLRFLSLSGSLRVFIFSVIIELTFSVSVTGLNSHPSVNPF
jgi:hypothetical protein